MLLSEFSEELRLLGFTHLLLANWVYLRYHSTMQHLLEYVIAFLLKSVVSFQLEQVVVYDGGVLLVWVD